jgi:hypothetical protein
VRKGREPAGVRSSQELPGVREWKGVLTVAGVSLAVYGLVQILPSLLSLLLLAVHGHTLKVCQIYGHLDK